jgi:hypothetical protein
MSPAMARSSATCLQNNRIWSTSVVNDRTLIVRDRQNNPFVVELSGGCTGLTSSLGGINFRTHTNLGCLRRGDRVSFRNPAFSRRDTCFVREVHTDFSRVASSARRPSIRATVTR